ncbi:chemotaxis protein CheW [Nucisporomicrobium flavum]|uniref:chemotaxis protein CheW n=1 Tax=Nucisporomicrobium flavum TaxID=2785915 RepID=UPI001F36D620|nr:chemotaxis protein CheW [Nucisporomicrobium flavum]
MGQVGQAAAGTAAGEPSLVFRAGPLLGALRLSEVVETMRPLPVHHLAGTPPFISGICVMRGLPTLVVDVTRLLSGGETAAERYVAVRTGRGTVALATGAVLGIHTLAADGEGRHAGLLGEAPARLIAAVGTVDAQPVLLLQSLHLVPDDAWAAAAATAAAS